MSIFVVLVKSPSQHNAFAMPLLDPLLPVPIDIKGPATKRFAVYRNNVAVSLVRAMEANFPAIRRLLGNEYFNGLAREFIKAYPPQNPILFFYGSHFAEYLEEQDDLSNYPYLGDVARLEQLWRTSYHAADAPCLSHASISALNDEQLSALCLKPHPAFAVFSSRFSVHSIFVANRTDGEVAAVKHNIAEHVLITRTHYDVEVRSISYGTLVFMQALADGNCLGAAANIAVEVDQSLDLADCISTLLVAGVFLQIEIER